MGGGLAFALGVDLCDLGICDTTSQAGGPGRRCSCETFNAVADACGVWCTVNVNTAICFSYKPSDDSG